jgi:hypothetical protein
MQEQKLEEKNAAILGPLAGIEPEALRLRCQKS